MLHSQDSFPFDRTSALYPPDGVRALAPSHCYEGRITSSETKLSSFSQPVSIRRVDDAVSVESVDDRTRQLALDYFASCSHQASKEAHRHKVSLYAGIAGSVAGAGVGAAAFFVAAPLVVPAALCGAVLTVSGLWNTWTTTRALQGLRQDQSDLERRRDLWQDPVGLVIDQRRRAGQEGFSYVFDHRLKDKVVHEQEVEALWQRDVISLFSRPADAAEVFSKNLLGIEQTQYALGSRPLPSLMVSGRTVTSSALHSLLDRYRSSRHSYQLFEHAIDSELATLRSQYEQQAGVISSLRLQWLLPAERLRCIGLEEADFLYHQAIEPFRREKNAAIAQVERSYGYCIRYPGDVQELRYKQELDRLKATAIAAIERQYLTHPAVLTIEDAYRRDRQLCHFLYQQSRLVVDSFFDRKSHQLDAAWQQSRSLMEQQRACGRREFSTQLDKMFSAESEEAVHRAPSAVPRVDRCARLPDFAVEPSWHEIYGLRPQFQSHFSSDISETGWNLFWGITGLGRYASAPRSSWSNLWADRNAYPFKRQWFRLHSVCNGAAPGLFHQRLCVPPPPVHCGSRDHAPVGTRVPRREECHAPVGTRVPERGECHAPVGNRIPAREECHATVGTNTPAREEGRAPVGTRRATGYATTQRR